MYDYRTFKFGKGKHARREDGLCVNEAAAWLAGEEHSDHPRCLCPVIAPLSIWVNDSCEDDLRNELLRDLPWRLVGTKATPEIEQQRGFMAADWAVRFVCPIMLRRGGLEAEAVKLESLPVVDSANAARAARAAARATRATRATRAAAYASARAAYAAYAASAYASVDAANAAADAANAAADDREIIQRSCVDLIDRMIRLSEPQEVVRTQPVFQAATN